MGLRAHKNPQPPTTFQFNPRDLTKVGSGFYSAVYKVKSNGIAVCIKRFLSQPDNDVIINPHLQTQTNRYIASGQVGYYQNKLVLVSPFVENGSLEGYIDGIVNNRGSQPFISDIPRADFATNIQAFADNNLGMTLARLSMARKMAQNELHNMGVLHLDTADRNFLLNDDLSVKINDFGLSHFIPENGVIVNNSLKIPRNYADKRSLTRDGGYTIAFDLYAMKVTQLETLAKAVGVKPFLGINSLDYNKHTRNMDDNAKLRELLKDIEKKGAEFIKRNPDIKVYIDSYKAYLTTMPTALATYNVRQLADVRNDDNARFMQATKKFQEEMEKNALLKGGNEIRTTISQFKQLNTFDGKPFTLAVNAKPHVPSQIQESYKQNIVNVKPQPVEYSILNAQKPSVSEYNEFKELDRLQNPIYSPVAQETPVTNSEYAPPSTLSSNATEYANVGDPTPTSSSEYSSPTLLNKSETVYANVEDQKNETQIDANVNLTEYANVEAQKPKPSNSMTSILRTLAGGDTKKAVQQVETKTEYSAPDGIKKEEAPSSVGYSEPDIAPKQEEESTPKFKR